MSFVFAFDHDHDQAPMELKDLLGGKGANLAEMSSVLELPVPPGFTISTEACRSYMDSGWPEGLDEELAAHRVRLESATGRRLGDPSSPLLVSVRSGAKFSMPGMMDTVLDLGLNDDSVEGLAETFGDRRFALDSYRRFVQMYGEIVLGIDGGAFDRIFDGIKADNGVAADADLEPEALSTVLGALQGTGTRIDRCAFPPIARPTVARGDRGGLPILELTAGSGVPASRAHRGRHGNGRERADDGVRQHRRHLLHRRWVSRATRPRVSPAATAISWSTHRARMWWRESGPPDRCTRWRESSPVPTPSCSTSSTDSSSTTATCSTPSSPSSAASSGCSRCGLVNEPVPPHCV